MNSRLPDRISVIFAPPVAWLPGFKQYRPGEDPDHEALIRAMAAEGVDATIMDPAPWPLNPFHGRHPLYRGVDPARALQFLACKRSADMIMSVFESSVLIPLLARRVVGFKPALTMWDLAPDEAWRARRLVQDLTIPRADHLFLLASAQRSYVERRWGGRVPTSVVLQHVDAAFFRAEAPAPDGPIVTVGDDIGRDYDLLLRAVHDLPVDVVLKTRRPLAEHSGRVARVRQIRDRISFKALRDLYASARFVVVPLKDTLNVSGVTGILEAMAMGKAVVVNDNPMLRDYFVDGETALVVPVGDHGALRGAIDRLMARPEECEALGRAGRRMVEEKFSDPAFGTRFAAAIRRSLGR